MNKSLRIAILCTLLIPARVFAWGEEGHKTVCGIAWQRLSRDGKALVTRVLGTTDAKSFVEACLWADQVRSDRPDTYNYHFINIPAGVSGMNMQRDCAAPKRCAPWAIARYARELSDAKADPVKRAEALKFMMHFVGDLHQPLHAGRPGDRGGNDIFVEFFGNAGNGERRNNLHSVWDSQMLRRADVQWERWSPFLAGQLDADEAKSWETLDLVAWTNESYRICEEFVYGRLPKDGRIRNAYYLPGAAYEFLQMQKGGVRLAYLIDRIAGGQVPAI